MINASNLVVGSERVLKNCLLLSSCFIRAIIYQLAAVGTVSQGLHCRLQTLQAVLPGPMVGASCDNSLSLHVRPEEHRVALAARLTAHTDSYRDLGDTLTKGDVKKAGGG